MKRRQPAGGWARATEASVAVPFVIVFVMLLGFLALGTEIVHLLGVSRNMQSAADSAALAAETARMRGYPPQYANEAYALAGTAGWVRGQNGTTIAVNNPPTHGNYATNSNAVEVIISQPRAPLLTSFLHRSSYVVAARAVALGGSGSGCVLALDGSSSGAVQLAGNAAITLHDCGLYVDSSSPQALSLSGNATVNAPLVSIVGGYNLSGNAGITPVSGIKTHAAAVVDPYAGVALPTIGPCAHTSYSATSSSSPAKPGVYCNGFAVGGNTTLTMNPGTYILDRGSFAISDNAVVSGSGVTIVLTSSTGSGYAGVSITGNASLTLTAPAAGAAVGLPGLAFYQDRRAASSGSIQFGGNATPKITGAIYFPNQPVSYGGNASTGVSQCTQLVALRVTFTGNASFNYTCTGIGVSPIASGTVRLAE